jgi:hypothetical protein
MVAGLLCQLSNMRCKSQCSFKVREHKLSIDAACIV